MTKEPKSLRSARGVAAGLGSAKHGVEHWIQQRVSAVAILLLSFYLVWTFVNNVVFGDYEGANDWLSSPIDATLLILFIAVAFWHAALGLQVVIEDYVHGEALKITSILAVRFVAVTLAVLGILSTVKVLFWSIMPHG